MKKGKKKTYKLEGQQWFWFVDGFVDKVVKLGECKMSFVSLLPKKWCRYVIKLAYWLYMGIVTNFAIGHIVKEKQEESWQKKHCKQNTAFQTPSTELASTMKPKVVKLSLSPLPPSQLQKKICKNLQNERHYHCIYMNLYFVL